jgi:hypothetical protein
LTFWDSDSGKIAKVTMGGAESEGIYNGEWRREIMRTSCSLETYCRDRGSHCPLSKYPSGNEVHYIALEGLFLKSMERGLADQRQRVVI